MAAPAKTRIANMVAPGREVRRRRGGHDGLVAVVDVEGSILGPQVVLDRFRDHHVPNEGRVRPQPRLLNLVANGAGYPICCRAVPMGELLQRKERKNYIFSSSI